MTTNRKSYNKAALRGENYDDIQWQQDFAEATGIVVPDEYLFTPNAPKYAIDAMYEQNKRDFVEKMGLSPKDAEKRAMANKKAALKSLSELM